MLFTQLGMLIEVRPQHENANSPMLVTLLGMLMEVRLEQPENASTPMLFTLLGMLIEVRLEQSLNADFPMLVTVYLTPPLVTVDGIFTVFGFALSATPTTLTYLLLASITLYLKPFI